MRVVALVPRRSDGGRRDEVWAWIRDRWSREHPDIDVFEGEHTDGPFNRSAAINTAAAAAGEWDFAVIADADSFVGADQVTRSVRASRDAGGKITFAYDSFAYLGRRMSDKVMGGFVGDWVPGVEFTLMGTCSSMVVVPRGLWEQVGGFDEGFRGWGMEDVAFSIACHALGDGGIRTPGVCWHLWHPPATTKPPLYDANVARLEQYRLCDYDADKVRALLDELGVTS